MDTNQVKWANWFRNKDKFKKQLEEIVNAGLNTHSSKKVWIFNFGWVEEGIGHLHSAVLISARRDNDGDYELLIRDPNFHPSMLSTMHVASDFSSLTYKDLNIVIVQLIDVAEIPSNLLIDDIVSAVPINDIALLADESYDTISVVAYGNFTITNSRGETLTYNNGYLNGTMEIFHEDIVASGDSDYIEFVYEVGKSDGYTFTSENSRSSCRVKDGKNYIYVNAENASSIDINKERGISVLGNNLEYSVYTTTSTGNNFFEIAGQTNKHLSITLNSDGSGTVEADTLDNAVLEDLYNNTSWVLDGDSTFANFAETDDGKLVLPNYESAGPYKVTFKATGGIMSSEEAMITNESNKLSSLPVPNREGYTFCGWYTKAEGGEKADESKVYTEDTTLYAHWTETGTLPTPSHTHRWETALASNSNGHWHNCTVADCPITADSEKNGYAVHTSDGGKVTTAATAYQDGVRTYSCVVCGYVIRTESIPATGVYNPGSASSSSGGNSSSTPSYQITVSTASNGTVTVTPKSAKSGANVSIAVVPNDGYTIGSVNVKDRNGRSISITDNGGGTYTFTMPASKVSVDASFVKIKETLTQPTAPTISFTDVTSSAYYADAVAWAVEKGITVGTSSTTFNPDTPCTRAQIVTFLWRAAGSPQTSGNVRFTDVPGGTYYHDAVQWPVSQGIAKGVGKKTFNPNAPCTRAQAVTFLHRAKNAPSSIDSTRFIDVPQSAYYTNAVQWAVNNKITKGMGGKKFNPNMPCTRAQIITFLYRDSQK